MNNIWLAILLVSMGIFAILWTADRRRWKEKFKQQGEMDQTCRRQVESMKKELVRMKEEIKKMQIRSQEAEIQKEEQNKELEDTRNVFWKSTVKIHLYAQLLREQCENSDSKNQCDVIVQECERMGTHLQREIGKANKFQKTDSRL